MIYLADAQWLNLANRRAEHHHIEVRVKRPLYAASAVFNRTVTGTQWQVTAEIEGVLPLRKKWQANLSVAGNFANARGFQTHYERTSSRVMPLIWNSSDDQPSALDLKDESGSKRYLFSEEEAREVPVVSSADLLFAIQDVWSSNEKPKLLVAVMGRKLFAIGLNGEGSEAISGVLAPFGDFRNGWRASVLEALSVQGHEFQLGWNSRERLLTGIELKVPIIGHLHLAFA